MGDLSSASNRMAVEPVSGLLDIAVWIHLCHKMLFVISEVAGHAHKGSKSQKKTQVYVCLPPVQL